MSLGNISEALSVAAAAILPGSPRVPDRDSSPVPPRWSPATRKSSDVPQSRTCCHNGRSVMVDPRADRRVCSCQYSPTLLSPYTRLPLASNIYLSGGPYSSRPQLAPKTMSTDVSAYQTPLGANGSNIRDDVSTWRPLTQPSPSDTSSMSFYPYRPGYGGLDLHPRRKNATRESTNTLKGWLQEHIKNPYPTKGEKIMLAIITKMTLTQVSTWFANARRRLKKDDKLTWSPTHGSGDGEDEEEEDGENAVCGDEKRHSNERDENIEVDTQSIDVTVVTAFSKAAAVNNSENEPKTCRLSPPDLSASPAYGGGYPVHVDLASHKRKIWSVTDFLGSVHDDGRGTSRLASSEVNCLGSSSRSHPPDVFRDTSATSFFGSSGAPPPTCIVSQSTATFQTSIGYDGRAFAYSLPAFDELMCRPAVTPTLCRPAVTPTICRLSPFQTVRSLRMDHARDPRRDVPCSVKGV